VKRVVISDTHIGSSFYRSEELLEFLSTYDMDQLILAGDIIDFIKIPVLTANCAKILEVIGNKTDVIYIVGNHDESLAGWIGNEIFGVQFTRAVEFIDSGRSFRIEHGDSYNTSPIHAATFVKIVSVIQDILERWFGIDLTSWWVRRQLRKHKLRSISAILDVNNDVDVFIMGHTHIPEVVIWVHADQSIKTYVNSGDWVSNMTYVEIDNGKVRLREFKSQKLLVDENSPQSDN
jgi:UDP-2,3-diacylglucosamine pyrophosphatase LpxH